MKVIGLTGGIASGKSTVAAALRQMGAHIIDADKIAREIVRPGCPVLEEITRVFGADVLLPDGELDRVRLAERVFQDAAARSRLNSITHPEIREKIKSTLMKIYKEDPEAVAVIDAPLLIEAGMTEMVDEIWLVALPEELQITRAMVRDKISREDAEKRIRSQMPLAEKKKFARRVIDTSGSIADTVRQVVVLWNELSPGMTQAITE